MTESKKRAAVLSGDVPYELIYGGAKMIFEIISQALQKRRTLRAEIEQLKGTTKTQGQQIMVLEDRIAALENLSR